MLYINLRKAGSLLRSCNFDSVNCLLSLIKQWMLVKIANEYDTVSIVANSCKITCFV